MGPHARDIIFSGDKVQSRAGVAKFIQKYDELHRLEFKHPNYVILYLGKAEWPYPIPLIKVGNKWYFDVEAGREELLNRRIGADELTAIKVLEAYVKTQLEYASKDRDGDGVREFAQKIRSDKGEKNGLFWPTKPGEKRVPSGLWLPQPLQRDMSSTPENQRHIMDIASKFSPVRENTLPAAPTTMSSTAT